MRLLSRIIALIGAAGTVTACGSVANQMPDAEEVEPNDSIGTATDLVYETDGFKGQCESAGALDFFTRSAAAAGTAHAEIDLAGVSVALVTSSGAVIAEATGTVDGAVGAAGTVYLRITCPGVGAYRALLDTPE